ncbi:hypothetical protein PRUPE_2G059600 [Prunus persica]|uniref:Uncharacterized protein n=1 Tax=Prunus persica TaxID=3760 RepID=A0A251QC11_PRUPE|nr:hypothetical protein PRUPE_2G059600 [Prunus persica]
MSLEEVKVLGQHLLLGFPSGFFWPILHTLDWLYDWRISSQISLWCVTFIHKLFSFLPVMEYSRNCMHAGYSIELPPPATTSFGSTNSQNVYQLMYPPLGTIHCHNTLV